MINLHACQKPEAYTNKFSRSSSRYSKHNKKVDSRRKPSTSLLGCTGCADKYQHRCPPS